MKRVLGVLLPCGLLTQGAAAQVLDAQVSHWDVPAMQRLIEQENLSFSVGETWVSRYLRDGGDIRDVTGLVRPEILDLSVPVIDLAVDPDLPAHFDWREQVEGGLQPVRNQGACGSCWAFSVTAVLESLVRIAAPGADVDLAEQTLVSTCSSSGSCNGGYFSAFNYLKNPGLPDESQDPYRAVNTSCRSGLVPKQKIESWAYIGNDGRQPTTEQIKTAIYNYGPVSVDVNGSFSSYTGGVYDRCNTSSTNHMVTLEGWDEEGGYWIMRNSWGADWGEDGYMRIKYTNASGSKCNGIGRVAAFAALADPPALLRRHR
jgi:C1A family cysteine protease